jgi:hypothetical protein
LPVERITELTGKTSLLRIFAFSRTQPAFDFSTEHGISCIRRNFRGECSFSFSERKNKNPFSFKPYARLLFSCNEIPRNYGDRSEGFYRRLIIIRFENPVPPEKRDPNLIEKLASERDGIFMWALVYFLADRNLPAVQFNEILLVHPFPPPFPKAQGKEVGRTAASR